MKSIISIIEFYRVPPFKFAHLSKIACFCPSMLIIYLGCMCLYMIYTALLGKLVQSVCKLDIFAWLYTVNTLLSFFDIL